MSAIREGFWRVVAWVISRNTVLLWLLVRAYERPYTHITALNDSNDIYMYRYWLFNPYPAPGVYDKRGVWNVLPSIRLHHIMHPDSDRHLHNHPWNSRTLIAAGSYLEERSTGLRLRTQGDTAVIRHSDYHRITKVWGPDGGTITVFITWRKRGSWGFKLDDGSHMPYKQYLGIK